MLAGWGLASYNFNLPVLALSDIANSFHLSATLVGFLGFVVYAATFAIAFSVGFGMDAFDRKWI